MSWQFSPYFCSFQGKLLIVVIPGLFVNSEKLTHLFAFFGDSPDLKPGLVQWLMADDGGSFVNISTLIAAPMVPLQFFAIQQ